MRICHSLFYDILRVVSEQISSFNGVDDYFARSNL